METPSPIEKKSFDLGKVIRSERAARNLTQAELAQKAGVSTRWLLDAEKNKFAEKLRVAQIERLAVALGYDKEDFLALAGIRQQSVHKPSPNEAENLSSSPVVAPEVFSTVKNAIFAAQLDPNPKKDLLNWVDNFEALPDWREQMLQLCKAINTVDQKLKKQVAKGREPDLLTSMRQCAMQVTLEQTAERLMQAMNDEKFMFDDPATFQDLWSLIFSQTKSKVWTTNLSRVGVSGGRTDKEWAIKPQREACQRLGNPISISRLYVLRCEDCDESKDLLKLASILEMHWAIGIRIGLISKRKFESVIADHQQEIQSADFMLIDEQLLHFTAFVSDSNRVKEIAFSINDKSLSAAKYLIEKFEHAGTDAKWYPRRDDSSMQSPDFHAELISFNL